MWLARHKSGAIDDQRHDPNPMEGQSVRGGHPLRPVRRGDDDYGVVAAEQVRFAFEDPIQGDTPVCGDDGQEVKEPIQADDGRDRAG